MERYFVFKNKFLNFSDTKKFSTESFLTLRELQPLVSYKRVSYKKKMRVFRQRNPHRFQYIEKHQSVSIKNQTEKKAKSDMFQSTLFQQRENKHW